MRRAILFVTGASQNLSRTLAGELVVGEHRLSVDDDIPHSLGQRIGMCEVGAIGHGLQIKDDQVRRQSFGDPPAIVCHHGVGCRRTSLGYGALERNRAEISYVSGQQSREGPIGSRVRCRPRSASGTDVGAKGNERLLHRQDLVRLGHALWQHEGTLLGEVEKSIPGILLPRFGDRQHAATRHVGVTWIFALSHDHAVPVVADVSKPILPALGLLHFAANFGPQFASSCNRFRSRS